MELFGEHPLKHRGWLYPCYFCNTLISRYNIYIEDYTVRGMCHKKHKNREVKIYTCKDCENEFYSKYIQDNENFTYLNVLQND